MEGHVSVSGGGIPFEYSDGAVEKIFREIGLSQGWWNSGGPMVIAVSGGSDSMAMLWMFASFWPGKKVIAHLDHGIRGEEAREDARFVAGVAERFGIPLEIAFLPVPELLLKGESLEDGARRIRYDFLEKARILHGAVGIAVAHTADDMAETFLMNLMRGTGIAGLTGIQERRGAIFRPVTRFSREYLRRLLELRGIPWREDGSNLDNAYTRNRVRNLLLPMMQDEFNRGVKEHILGVAEDLSFVRGEEEDAQDSLASLALTRIPFADYACSSDFPKTMDERTLPLFFRGIGRRLGLRTLSRNRMDILCRLARSGSGWCFQWQKERFVFSSSRIVAWVEPDILLQTGPSPFSADVRGGTGFFSWGGWTFRWSRKSAGFVSRGALHAFLPNSDFLHVLPASSCAWRKKAGAGVPSWCRTLVPVILAGNEEWVPFWGERGGEVRDGPADVLHVVTSFPQKEKERENELRPEEGPDS